jgi:hypothetical protein
MQQTSQIIIRVDEGLKKQAQDAARNAGLPLSVMIKTFLQEMAANKNRSLADIYEETYFDYVVMEAMHGAKISAILEEIAAVARKKCR